MTCKRGQSAMEFLMTYGWAILIMLVVIAVLFYLGILNPRGVAPNALAFPAGFTAYDYQLDSSGRLYLDLGQATGDDITVLAVRCSTSAGGDSPSGVSPVTSLIPNGEHAIVANGIQCDGASGTFYKGKVTIYYSKVTTPTFVHKVVGDLSHKIEAGTSGGGITPGETPGETATPEDTATPEATATSTPTDVIETCGYTIDGPGTYVLEGDLTGCDGSGLAGSSGDGLSFAPTTWAILFDTGSDGAVLDCRGNTIEGTAGFGVKALSRTGVTIQNCVIDGFVYGVGVDDSQACLVTGNTMRNYDYMGVSVGSATSTGASNNVFTGNLLEGGESGFELEGSSGNNFTGNTLTGMSNYGFRLRNSEGNIIESNSLSGFVGGSSEGVFLVHHASSNTIAGNTVTGAAKGIAFEDDSDDNVVYSNTVTGCSGPGILVAYTCSDNVFTSNTATGNGIDDFACESDDDNIDGGGNSCGSNSCYAWLRSCGGTPITSCGTAIGSPGLYVLDSDLGPCSGAMAGPERDGLSFAELGSYAIRFDGEASGSVLDCRGHTIAGTATAGLYLLFSDGVEVENCVIQGFERGVYLQSLEFASFKNNTIEYTDYGFYIGSYGHTFEGNTVTNNGLYDFYQYSNPDNDSNDEDNTCSTKNSNCDWLTSCGTVQQP